MPVLDNAYTTLSNVKLIAGISATDTTYDAILTRYINVASAQIESYIGRSLARTTYTEYYNGLGRQNLLLRAYPVQSVVYIKDNGATLTENSDYFLQAQDKKRGMVYRPQGWFGDYEIRGLDEEPIAGSRSLEVQYVAGYYLPTHASYVEGSADSLPIDITFAVDDWIVTLFRQYQNQSQGLKQLREGGLSYTWFEGNEATNNDAGLPQVLAGILNEYKEVSVA
jgi:hypothetical protein